MKKLGLLSTSAIGSVAFMGFAIATPAMAAQQGPGGTDPQNTPACDNLPAGQDRETCLAAHQPNANAPDTAEQAITVTGSRIKRPDLESTVPVATFRGEDIYQEANTNVGEALNNLPQLRSTFSQQNPGLGIGIAGLNLLDLRGLGVRRTLVLVNGRRHVPSDIQNSTASVDINNIPTDLIERIDIVTGGNSAVYGSDAIAGVVNFVLKDHYEGIQLRAGDSVPQYGAGSEQYASILAGRNFADGRGNVAVNVEYSHQERLFATSVPFLRIVNGFITNDNDGVLPNGSDGIPDTVFAHDLRSSTISRFGLVPIVETRAATPQCGLGIPSGAGTRTAYNCNYIFGPGGQLVFQTGDRVSTGPNGTFIGGNGDNNREDRLLSILPFNERITANLIGHFTFSDAATFFVEAKYARAHTVGSNSGPAFDQGAGVTFADARANIRLDNPFLAPGVRQTLSGLILQSGSTTGLTGGAPLSASNIANIANGSFRFVLAKNFTDLGIRDEDALRETYRIVAGFRGDIMPHLSYEVSGNYGRQDERIKILGNVNVQRLLLALDAGRDPVTGQIKCRSQFDPAAATPVADVDGAAFLAADIAACVPYNPFGAPDNTAARAYITSNAGDHGRLTQEDVTAFLSADSGGFFNLPGGPISVVVGGEWRREDAFFTADPEIQNGQTFLNALQTFNPPAEQVTEGFGEINIPLLKDMPFFRSLSASGAVRVSKYNKAYGSTGTTWAWNFGGEWAPTQDIRFRANYGKAVRAPNYSETASPLVQDFAPGFGDPCNANRIGSGTPARVTNCQTELAPVFANATANAQFQNLTGLVYSLEILSGSNPLLKAETSKSLTVGAVITPRWVPGFDVTVDYFDINVHNVIAAASAQTIVNLCYDQGTFCNLFQRNLTTGLGPNGEVPGEIIHQSLINSGLNFANLHRRGIDVQMTYAHQISSNVRVNARAYYTHQLVNSNFTDPTKPTFESRLLDQLGDPKDEVVFNASLTVGKYTFGYGAHYIGRMLNTAYANLFPINGNPPLNLDATDIRYFPSVIYQNVRFAVQLGSTAQNHRGFQWFFGIDNITNQHPPLGSAATGSGSAIYDIRGRTYFSGIKATF